MFVVSRNPNGTPGPIVELSLDPEARLEVNGKRVWAVRVYGTLTSLETGREVIFILTDDYLNWEHRIAHHDSGDTGRW